MVGRTAELDRIRDVLATARGGRSAALLIEGDAGVGKTTLLSAAADLAPDFVTLHARGVDAEAHLDHAGLLAAVGPLRDRLADVPPRQGSALAAALGWSTGDAPDGPVGDRFLVGAGTMALLASAAADTPVLVLVDDLQWLDSESAQALLFAARRLAADAVAFLVATRPDDTFPVPTAGLDRLRVGGLAETEAAALLRGDVAAQVAARLTAATGGNPLALLEAAASLTPAQRVGAEPLPAQLPVGPRLTDAYGRMLAGLSPAARWAALLLAASRDEDEATVAEAVRADGLDPADAFDEAEARGVVETGPGVLRFRHPLLRTAAWRSATPAERRRAHRALAASLPGQRAERLWHLAAATPGRDEPLAVELVTIAEEMRARRGFAAAAAALERAAVLSVDPRAAGARLASAVEDAVLAGDVDRARALAERVLAAEAGADERSRAAVLHALGTVEEFAGSVPNAARLQRAAAELADGLVRVRALAQLTMLSYRLDDPAGMRTAAEALERAADPDDPEQRMLAAYGLGAAHVFGGDPAYGRTLVRQAVELLETDRSLREEPRYLLFALVAGRWLADFSVLAQSVDRRLGRARELGALGVLVPAMSILAAGRALFGDHAGAYADAGEAVELGEALGHTSELSLAYQVLAWEGAARGRFDEVDRHLAAARRLVERAGTTGVAEHLLRTEADCALARGDLDRVVAALEPRLAVSTGRSGHVGDSLPVAPVLVEAYLGLRRSADAARLAERYDAANPTPRGPGVEALARRCHGLVATDPAAAAGHFAAALTAHERWPDPFEAARTRLLYGSVLRRDGHRVAAREQLRAARDAFAAMDCPHWADRAAGELAATGETARRRRTGPGDALTSQETRVALLVARGLTNREVAAALFLSPKTVEHHVGSVLRKRGLRSRTELAGSFAARAGEQPPTPAGGA